MKNKIIVAAILSPHGYPWERDLSDFTVEEIKSVLDDKDLNDTDERRIAAWNIEIAAYKAMLDDSITSKNDLEEYIVAALKGRSYVCNESIEAIIKRKKLFGKNEIDLYKKFINNTLSTEEKAKNNLTIIYWSIDLLMYYKLSQNGSNYSAKDLEKDIEKFISDNFSEIEIAKSKINEAQYRRGYTRKDVLRLFASNFKETNEFRTFFKNLKLDEMKEEVKEEVKEEAIPEEKSLQDSIMDIFKAASLNSGISEGENKTENIAEPCNKDIALEETLKAEPEVINEISNNKEARDQETKVVNIRLEEHLSGLCEELGYKIAKEDEVILSKEKYNKIIQADEDKEIKILKELVSIKNGAILSELYNTYKNIDSISKDNIEAVLNNFFNTLSLLGCEVESEGNKVGDLVKVNTGNVLKDFIFNRAVDCDGEIEGSIEYHGWSYKGRKISPMIIKPSK